MNQQRSRRFRSSQEAKEKEEARQESLILWERELYMPVDLGLASAEIFTFRNGSDRHRWKCGTKHHGIQMLLLRGPLLWNF